MIEIRSSVGDEAEADSPEAAVLAGRTLLDDAHEASPHWGNEPTVTFWVDDQLVAGPFTRKTLNQATTTGRLPS